MLQTAAIITNKLWVIELCDQIRARKSHSLRYQKTFTFLCTEPHDMLFFVLLLDFHA
jgi:hypothetical protein